MEREKYILRYTDKEGKEYALYRHASIISRRYRDYYPNPDGKELKLLIIPSLKKAEQEKIQLFVNCGEMYRIEKTTI